MISKIFRTVAPVVVAIVSLSLVTPASLNAQSALSPVANRLTQPVDESSRVTLKGTVHPLANAANDRGAAPDSMPLDRLQIVLQRSAAQESTLQQLIHDEHTPGTASYHKWLTPAQFGQQFGPSDQDVATLSSWLESKGFNVKGVNPGKQTLEISGNVAQFRSAFHAQIHKYAVNGEFHYANATDPQVPAALAPVFGGFASLNNFRPHRTSHILGQATYDPKTDKATPQWTYGTGNQVNFVLAPGDFGVQYDLPNASLNSGFSGTTYDGTGQTIAIINDANINIDLVNQFRTLFNLPANPPQVIISGNDPGVDGINDPDGSNGDSSEAYLDVEWAGAVAPKATVDLVIGADTALETGLILAAEDAVYNNLAPVMSISFGLGCESQLGNSNQYLNALWEQAAAQGITVMVSTGDSASAGCDSDTQYYAVGGAAVSGLASTPWNVAVGGTDFFYSDYATGGASISNYWNTTASQNPSTSIKGVIPEQPWNDSQYGLNIFSAYTDSGNTATSISGGSGGASTVYAKPAWQTGTGVPADNHRDLPDVSLFAANGLNASYYPICYADADCQPASGSNLIQITGIGGTSASSPAFAGIMALVNQKYGRQGQANFVLYPLAKQFPAAFHDVTHGTNSVPCNIGTVSGPSGTFPALDCIAVSNPITVTDPNLGTATEGQTGTGTTPEFNATAGFDLASGLGSVDANVLISDWANVKLTSSTVSLTSPSAGASFTHGQSVTFTGAVAASGGSPTPTGNVAIETDSTESGQQGQGFPGLFQGATTNSTLALSSGSFNGSLTTLPGGTYNVWASYSGDGTNAAAQSGKTQITVSPESSGIYFAVDDVATGRAGAGPAIASGATVTYGTQLILSAQVAPSSQLTAFTNCQTGATACPVFTIPTGTVAFADNGTNNNTSALINTAVINSEGDAEFNAPFAVGSHSVIANYSGDSSYKSSISSTITFTVGKDTPTMNVVPSLSTQSGALIGGQQNVITVQLVNTTNQANESTFNLGFTTPISAPTGTVTVTGLPGGTQSATLASLVDPQTLSVVGIATFTIPSTAAANTYSVTVSYPGDSNYANVSQSLSIPIQGVGGVASTTTASISGSISPNTTLTISGTVTGKTGDPAPSNANGGVEIYVSGYEVTVPLTAGSGDSSTFSATFDSRGLLQGANAITAQFLGDNTYAPSAITLTPAISNPLSDFTMVPEEQIISVPSSGTATDTINVSSVNGFAGAVSITCTPASGIICTLNPGAPTLTGGGSAAVTLNIDATNVTTAGSYNVLLTGTDSTGEFIHTLSLNVVAPASTATPGFSVTPASGSLNVAAGNTATDALTVSPTGGFTGAVAFTCAVSGGPSGATSAPTCSAPNANIAAVATTATSSLSVATTATTTTGSYTATVTGSDVATGKVTATATVDIVVGVAPGFALANGGTITISSPGATTGNTTSISVTPSGGFTGTVNFTCAVTTSPSGATDSPTCSAPAANVSGTGAASSTLTVSTTAGTTAAARHPLDKFFAAGGGIVVAGLFLFGIPARRRNWRSILAILLFAGIVGLGIGCGGSSGNSGGGGGGGSTGTTTGAYVVTVTGKDAATGMITATTTVNVTVN